MTSLFLHQVLAAAWRARISWFLPIWATMTGAIAVGLAWVLSRAPDPAAPIATEVHFIRKRRSVGDVAALTLLASALVGYTAMTLKWENFANWDDAYFTLFTLRGHNMAPPIWRDNGRFFPLAHQEFNLIRRVTSSVAGYHAFPLIQLVLLCFILVALDGELTIATRATLALVVLLLPGVVTSFMGLVFPERNVLFWLACLVLFTKLFERTNASTWAALAVVCAQAMIYYKETASLLLLGFAGGRLALRCKLNEGGWDLGRLRNKQSYLDLSLISCGVFFYSITWQ